MFDVRSSPGGAGLNVSRPGTSPLMSLLKLRRKMAAGDCVSRSGAVKELPALATQRIENELCLLY